MLSCPKEAVADPLPNYLLECFLVQYYQVFKEAAVAEQQDIFIFCSGHHGVQGCSQQYIACIDMCVVYQYIACMICV